MVTVCTPCTAFAGFPLAYALSNSAPITWKADQWLGPASTTQSRISSPGLATKGWSLNWLASPLNTMYWGWLASIAL